MSRRYYKKKKSNGALLIQVIGDLIYVCSYIVFVVGYLIVKLITLIISMIIFKKSEYKNKSGNGYFRTMFNKGNKGEYLLYKKIIKAFGKNNVLTNIYLPSKNIDNTEIDVLAIRNEKIYCFEMKNYGGYIYGRLSDHDWTQVLKYRTKNRFFNPIRQNYAHTKALEDYLGISEESIESIVVFANRANLDNVEKGNAIITYLKDIKYSFKDELDEYQKERDNIIIEKLSARTLMDENVKQEHIEQVEKLKETE